MSIGGHRLKEWIPIAAWTACGPLFCVLVALGYNIMTFAGFPSEIRVRAALAAIIVPFGLATPFFFYFSIKLRELASANRQLSLLAATDGLTNCLNRTAFTALVEARLEALVPQGDHVHGALLVIDADNFKQINDRFGHHNGDIALTLIARAIRSSVRAGDNVGRLGGEEFGVFLPVVDRYGAETVAERLRRAVEKLAFVADGHHHQLTVSVGGVVFDRRTGFEELFRLADERLYAAKNEGRNTVRLIGCATSGAGFAILDS
ncbi:GGDEF domain-containing protein [Pelagibacterium flavum]|uniref:diguanylate cyclase n=1 Tax=Pelagibacterium flavum TaxID=2984530 RepID=A0ABY6ITN7_9HYPH|nr:GGDEF domain-containing protein [Pelagibacterium sp. YIM 151497]UYQ73984.1 GGDEF domain-containing protein [Pelagibacterium sp. YIM 151497]